MAKIYGCKKKTLYTNNYFCLDTYDEVIGNPNTEDFQSQIFCKLPTQEEVKIMKMEKKIVET